MSKDPVDPVSRPQSFCLMLRSLDVVSLFFTVSLSSCILVEKFTESGGYSVFQETLMNSSYESLEIPVMFFFSSGEYRRIHRI